METATHIAVGNDYGDHYRRTADGIWHLCRLGQFPVLVTVDETIEALERLATIGQS